MTVGQNLNQHSREPPSYNKYIKVYKKKKGLLYINRNPFYYFKAF